MDKRPLLNINPVRSIDRLDDPVTRCYERGARSRGITAVLSLNGRLNSRSRISVCQLEQEQGRDGVVNSAFAVRVLLNYGNTQRREGKRVWSPTGIPVVLQLN